MNVEGAAAEEKDVEVEAKKRSARKASLSSLRQAGQRRHFVVETVGLPNTACSAAEANNKLLVTLN